MEKKYIAVHHTAVKNQNSPQLFAVNRYHKGKWNMKSKLGWYVGYNYFIDFDGKTTQTRAWNEETIANVGHNCDVPERCDTISICLADNYNSSRFVRSVQNEALEKQIQDIKRSHPNIKVVGHRDLQTSRTCPGAHIGDDYFTAWNDVQPNDSEDDEKEKQIAKLQSLLDKLKALLLALRS